MKQTGGLEEGARRFPLRQMGRRWHHSVGRETSRGTGFLVKSHSCLGFFLVEMYEGQANKTVSRQMGAARGRQLAGATDWWLS